MATRIAKRRPSRYQRLRNPTSWVAGVLDACGRFQVQGQGRHWYARIQASVPEEVGRELSRLLGGVWDSARSEWSCPASRQERLLNVVVPYMRCWGQIDAARAVLMFRVTSGGKGRRVPSATLKARRGFRKLAGGKR